MGESKRRSDSSHVSGSVIVRYVLLVPFRIAIGLSAIALSAFATVRVSAQDPSRPLTTAAMRTDFEVLRSALEEAHGGYDRHATRAATNARLLAMQRTITANRSHAAFTGLVAEAVTSMGDGHLRLEYDPATMDALANARVFPLRVSLERDRLVVVSNDTPSDTTISPGMEIVRINGRTVPQLLDILIPKMSGDGMIRTGRRIRVSREFATQYWLYVERSGVFTIDARSAPGRAITTRMNGIFERDRRQTVNPVNPVNAVYAANAKRSDSTTGLIGVEMLENNKVARLRIRGFDGAAFPATLDSAFALIRKNGAEKVVLDLRGNGGGVDEYGALLVGHFLETPFRYFDRIHLPTIAPHFATWPDRTFAALKGGTTVDPKGGFLVTSAYHTGVGMQQPAAEPFRGQVVTLIDGATFSTAADVSAQLRSTGRSTFVGEETGGGYEGNTSALNAIVVLPYSGLRLKIMMYDYWNAVKPPAVRSRGTLPDDSTMTRVADVLRGEDPALARAIAMPPSK